MDGCNRILRELKNRAIRTLAAKYLRDEGEVRKGEEVGLDSPLLAYLFGNAQQPCLRKHARILAPFLDESILRQVGDERLLPVERTWTSEMHRAAQGAGCVGASAPVPPAGCDVK
jgi:hypothetical protein